VAQLSDLGSGPPGQVYDVEAKSTIREEGIVPAGVRSYLKASGRCPHHH